MTRGVDAGPWMTLRSDQTVLPHRIFRLFESLIGYQLNRWKNLMPGMAVAVLLYAVPLNVLSDPTNSPLPLPNLRQADDDTRLWLPQLDTGFRTHISVQPSLLPQSGIAAPVFLAVEISTTLTRIRELRQSGASGLALALLKEIETEHKSDWLEWEQELWLALRAAGDYTMLLSRLQSALSRLDGVLKARVYVEIAGVHILQDNPRRARSVLRAMWVDSEPDNHTAMTARRLMIDAYRAENLFLDADAACSRFQSEYYPDDASWGELRATILLESGRPGEALRYLVGQQGEQAKRLRLVARLREGSYSADDVLTRLGASTEQSNVGVDAHFYWGIMAEAALLAKDWSSRVKALEWLLASGVKTKAPVLPPTRVQLLTAYNRLAAEILPVIPFGPQDPGSWINAVESAGVGPEGQRALLVTILRTGVEEDAVGILTRSLVASLIETQLSPLVLLLYGDTAPMGSESQIEDDLLQALAQEAVQNQHYALAARLSGKMRAPPPNMNEGEWVLRRSRIQIFAGQADDGLIAVVDWLSGSDQLSEEMLDRVMQVLFDLQTIGRHALALKGFAQAANLVQTPRQRQELFFWIAESHAALNEHVRSADLFLRSAVVDTRTATASRWSQSARFKAAVQLTQAGLLTDARMIYLDLLQQADDRNQQLVLKQKIQDLDLRQTWSH